MPHTRARTDEEEIEGDLSPPAVEIVMADILGEEPVEEMSMTIGEGVGETVLQVEEQELEMADLRDSLGDGGEDDRAGTGGGALEMAMGAAGGMSNGHLEHGGDLNGNGETDDRRELRIEIDGGEFGHHLVIRPCLSWSHRRYRAAPSGDGGRKRRGRGRLHRPLRRRGV